MIEYKEYYELFKQNPEWEVEHDNHKEGFNGKGNPELEKAITEMVDNDDTLFFFEAKTFHFSMLLLNKQNATHLSHRRVLAIFYNILRL